MHAPLEIADTEIGSITTRYALRIAPTWSLSLSVVSVVIEVSTSVYPYTAYTSKMAHAYVAAIILYTIT